MNSTSNTAVSRAVSEQLAIDNSCVEVFTFQDNRFYVLLWTSIGLTILSRLVLVLFVCVIVRRLQKRGDKAKVATVLRRATYPIFAVALVKIALAIASFILLPKCNPGCPCVIYQKYSGFWSWLPVIPLLSGLTWLVRGIRIRLEASSIEKTTQGQQQAGAVSVAATPQQEVRPNNTASSDIENQQQNANT